VAWRLGGILAPHQLLFDHAEEVSAMTAKEGDILVTVFLKHDQTKTLDEINEHLERTGFRKNFPPDGMDVISWYVMMGIGQVVTVKLPAHRLRELNLAIERTAWGAFQTEFYATYDRLEAWHERRAQRDLAV
jgi:hypothetical protein